MLICLKKTRVYDVWISSYVWVKDRIIEDRGDKVRERDTEKRSWVITCAMFIPDPPENCYLNVKKIAKNCHWKKMTIFGNFLTFKWQFSGGSGSYISENVSIKWLFISCFGSGRGSGMVMMGLVAHLSQKYFVWYMIKLFWLGRSDSFDKIVYKIIKKMVLFMLLLKFILIVWHVFYCEHSLTVKPYPLEFILVVFLEMGSDRRVYDLMTWNIVTLWYHIYVTKIRISLLHAPIHELL